MSVEQTLLHGFIKQLESMRDRIVEMDGYVEEDFNNYFEVEVSLEEAIEYIQRALKDFDE